MSAPFRYSEADQHQHSLAFGQLLKAWRERNGWTQYTAYRWGKQVGFLVMAPSTLSVMENGKAPKPRPETFFAMAEVNRRLAEQDWGVIHERQLRVQVVQGLPLLGDDGQVWGPAQFWSCHVGLLPPPAALR